MAAIASSSNTIRSSRAKPLSGQAIHASARVLEKCGFAAEGYLRRDLYKGGEAIDLRVFGLLR